MVLELTQPLTEVSTRNIFWGGKGGRWLGLTTVSPSCADYLEIWEPQTPGTLRACPGLYGDYFTFFLNSYLKFAQIFTYLFNYFSYLF